MPRTHAVHSVLAAGLVDLLGDRVAGTATAGLPASPASARIPPSPGAVWLALDVRPVDQVFALVWRKAQQSCSVGGMSTIRLPLQVDFSNEHDFELLGMTLSS